MSGDKIAGAADAAPVNPEAANAANEVVAEQPKPKKGWLRHVTTDTFHEVDDIAAVHAAYPGQYEEMEKAPSPNSKKIGWPEPEGDAEA